MSVSCWIDVYIYVKNKNPQYTHNYVITLYIIHNIKTYPKHRIAKFTPNELSNNNPNNISILQKKTR